MLYLKTKAMGHVYTEYNETCSEICNKYHGLDQRCVTCMSMPSVLSGGL